MLDYDSFPHIHTGDAGVVAGIDFTRSALQENGFARLPRRMKHPI
jgi:hypothetical protein